MAHRNRALPGITALLFVACEGAIGTNPRTAPQDAYVNVTVQEPNAPEPFLAPEPVRSTPTQQDLARKYFPDADQALPPTRLFRLTRHQLDATARALLPSHVKSALVSTMPKDPLQTGYEFSAHLTINNANFTPYTTWVSQIAASVRANPRSVIDCAVGATGAACRDSRARTFVTQAFRGSASPAQVSKFAQFFSDRVAAVGETEATGDLVDLTLVSPSFIFRNEVHTDASKTLVPALRLQNLTYALADLPPEAVGLSSTAPDAAVGTPAALGATLDALLASKPAREKLQRFFLSWLEVKEPADFTISTTAFPSFTPVVAQAAVNETKALLTQTLSKSVPSLKDITQAPAPSTAPDTQHRFGIFTHSAVLASHSGPTTTRLVKRGVFFTRKVMCLDLGAPPSDAPTMAPEIPDATERQRIEAATSPPSCMGCHTYINPFGAMQESFDPIGRFRTTDEGKPVDPSIKISFLDEGVVSTQTTAEALKALTGSARFKQCFVRQLFRYYTGREEVAADAPVLRTMFLSFIQDDRQDILAPLRILAGSSRFSQRQEAP